MSEAKRGVDPLPTVTPTRRLDFDLGTDTKDDGKSLGPLTLPPRLTDAGKALKPLAKFLVGAMGLASEADVFKADGEGDEWANYFDDRYALAMGKALLDLSEYEIDIWRVAANMQASIHFASMVQYHASWDKIAVKGTYRQKESAGYIQNRYEEALAFFKGLNL